MILNKLKINDAETEFIIFRSPQRKHDLNSLSVNVGDSQNVPSVKVRNLGVIFDQSLQGALEKSAKVFTFRHLCNPDTCSNQ